LTLYDLFMCMYGFRMGLLGLVIWRIFLLVRSNCYYCGCTVAGTALRFANEWRSLYIINNIWF